MKNSLIGGSTAAITGATGLAKMTQMIPDDIGKLACMVGIVASLVVIVTSSIRTWVLYKMSEFERDMRKKEMDIKK